MMIKRFPLESGIDFGPWIEKFKSVQNEREARSSLQLEWSSAQNPEIARICQRILKTWTPVGIRQDLGYTRQTVYNLVLFPICDIGMPESRCSIEIRGTMENPRPKPLSPLEEFFTYFSGMKTYDVWFGEEVIELELPEEWQGSTMLCRLPTGDPLIVSPAGRVGWFYYSGALQEIFAENLEEAMYRFLDTITPLR